MANKQYVKQESFIKATANNFDTQGTAKNFGIAVGVLSLASLAVKGGKALVEAAKKRKGTTPKVNKKRH